jgi:hypothetical protein
MRSKNRGQMLNDWEERRKREVDEFVQYWSWDRVFTAWKERLAAFSVVIEPLFQEVSVHDPKNPDGREPALSWWPTGSIRSLQKSFQKHLDSWPGTVGPIHPSSYYTRQGELTTLDYLWSHKNDQENIAAILLSASLFSRTQSSRSPYPRENWPPRYCVEVLENWAYTKSLEKGPFSAWHFSCTEVLPFASNDYDYKNRWYFSIGTLFGRGACRVVSPVSTGCNLLYG